MLGGNVMCVLLQVTEVEGEAKQVTQMNSAAAQHEEQLGDLTARMAQQADMVAAAETAVAQLKEKLAGVRAQRDLALGKLQQVVKITAFEGIFAFDLSDGLSL
jgi:chromosome segregation ATPase